MVATVFSRSMVSKLVMCICCVILLSVAQLVVCLVCQKLLIKPCTTRHYCTEVYHYSTLVWQLVSLPGTFHTMALWFWNICFRALHYVFRSVVPLHSLSLKLCSVRYILHSALLECIVTVHFSYTALWCNYAVYCSIPPLNCSILALYCSIPSSDCSILSLDYSLSTAAYHHNTAGQIVSIWYSDLVQFVIKIVFRFHLFWYFVDVKCC